MDTGVVIGIGVGGSVVLLFFIIGIFLVVKHFRDKKKAEESMSWASATGHIIASNVRSEISTDSDGNQSTSYYPEVRYSYEYMGITYEGDRIAFGGKVGGSRKKASEMIQAYPLGKNLTVYCDPNNPEDAVLERRLGSKVPLIVGIVLILIALIVLCIGGIAAVTSLFAA